MRTGSNKLVFRSNYLYLVRTTGKCVICLKLDHYINWEFQSRSRYPACSYKLRVKRNGLDNHCTAQPLLCYFCSKLRTRKKVR